MLSLPSVWRICWNTCSTPHEALGLLANSEMLTLRMQCHYLFDQIWKEGKNKRHKSRQRLYVTLAKLMDVPIEE